MTLPSIMCRLCNGPSALAGTKHGRRSGREFVIQRCSWCGFAWVLDPWTDFDLIYDDAYYRGEGSDPSVDYAFEYDFPTRTVRKAEWSGVLRVIRELAPGATRWLDFGCGNGGLVRHVSANSNMSIAGFDTGAWAARAKCDGLAILEESELASLHGQFDVVTAIEVIEHVIDPVPFLKQIRNMLRPGGLVFLTTGNAAKAPVQFTDWRYVVPEIHVSYFTPRALHRALVAAGFRAEHPQTPAGFRDIIRFKILKNLNQREHRAWHSLMPWTLLSRLADKRYAVSALPIGRVL